jgi:hypothetical protein
VQAGGASVVWMHRSVRRARFGTRNRHRAPVVAYAASLIGSRTLARITTVLVPHEESRRSIGRIVFAPAACHAEPDARVVVSRNGHVVRQKEVRVTRGGRRMAGTSTDGTDRLRGYRVRIPGVSMGRTGRTGRTRRRGACGAVKFAANEITP